ncbi:MAG: hypothetical protein ACKOOL_00820 [Novosphingobium sp.]
MAISSGQAGADIVVTGRSLKDTAKDLAACLERHCPPDQDMAATVAHAENQFVAGDYAGAQRTLHASLGRNRKHGKAYPLELSNLLRANSRVAEHMGEAKDFQLSVLDMRDTLKNGYGENDFRTLVAQVEVGDSRAKLGYPDEAERIYQGVEQRALAAKQFRVASFARLRRALLARGRFDDEPSGANRKRLDMLLDMLIDQPLPQSQDFVLAAQVLRAREDRKSGSGASTDALVRTFAARGGADRPVLLYSEPLSRIDPRSAMPGEKDQREAWTRWSTDRRGQWIDVGFWVGADGHVSDAEVLRSSGSIDWSRKVLSNVGKRVYAPLKQDGDAAPGFYMVERYTLTARVSDGETGTHLRTREATPRIEMLSLTSDNVDSPPK